MLSYKEFELLKFELSWLNLIDKSSRYNKFADKVWVFNWCRRIQDSYINITDTNIFLLGGFTQISKHGT